MRTFHEEGLMSAIVVSAVHHLRVLPLMAHPLQLDEMGSEAAPEDLDRCRMSGEVLSDEEIVSRVKAAISSAFLVQSVNLIPMIPEEGHINLVSASSYILRASPLFVSYPFSLCLGISM